MPGAWRTWRGCRLIPPSFKAAAAESGGREGRRKRGRKMTSSTCCLCDSVSCSFEGGVGGGLGMECQAVV